MISPPFLKRNDQIAIVATARKISQEELGPALKIFSSWGFRVVMGKNILKKHHQYAGTDEERAADLQQALDDPEIKAIVFARGGYGNVRIIDRIDFSRFTDSPKWIAGYSDVTVLHSHIHSRFGIETLHCTMPFSISDSPGGEASLESMRKALTGEDLAYSFPSGGMNRKGIAEGILTGGNLSILYSMTGSVSDIETKGKILFIEDLDEYLYHIDRMMMNLKRSGKLCHLAGLIVGDMTEMKDNTVPFGKDAYEIISDAVKEYGYPVWYGFPAGHSGINHALILGKKVKMDIAETSTLRFL